MQLKIRVINFLDRQGKEKCLYQNSVTIHDDVRVDYDSLYQAFKFLYPSASFIEFCLSTY